MQSYWFGDVSERCCTLFIGDLNTIIDRVQSISSRQDTVIPLDWQQAVLCGICRDRTEYLAKLQEICIAAAERSIRERYSRKDAELLQMVRTLDEFDKVINLISERAAEWYMVKHPAFSRKYRRTPAHLLVKTMRERNKGALGSVAGEIERLAETRIILAKEVSVRANNVIPNTSALIGGLVAARLLSHAGGLLFTLPAPGKCDPGTGCPSGTVFPSQNTIPMPQAWDHLSTPPGLMHPGVCGEKFPGFLPENLRSRHGSIISGECSSPDFIDAAQERIDGTGKRGES